MATQFANGKIVTDGLVLSTNVADRTSYVSQSSTVYDASQNGYNFSLVNTPGYNSNNGGSLIFDGTNQYTLLTDANIQNYTTVTAVLWRNLVSYKSDYETYVSYGANEAFLNTGWGIRRSLANNFQFWGGTGNTGLSLYRNTALLASGVSTYLGASGNNTGNLEMLTLVAKGVNAWSHSRLSIATRSDTLNSFTNMNWYSFYLYNRELSYQEIVQNYNAQKSRFGLK